MDLILVRHARPIRSDGDHASPDPSLSDRGREQAEATAQFLAGEHIDHVVASTLRRAIETAEPLAKRVGVEIETLDGLREIDPFEGAYIPAEEMSLDNPIVQRVAERWADDPFALFQGEGGFHQFRATVTEALDGVVARNRGKRVAVFCHGSVIGSYLTTLIGHQDPFMLLPEYCGLYRILASSNGVRTLRSANETGHVRGLVP